MVKIAVAGGSGNVASEIIDVLLARNKHKIIIFTRKDVPASSNPAVTYIKTDYSSVDELKINLAGVHTVLSFVAPYLDQDEAANAQKRLIDASVQANVKRFAPSEWAFASSKHLSWYSYKATTREYLASINKDKKVLEYSLFQPGLFTNYLTRPYQSSNHIKPLDTPFNFAERKALVRDQGGDDKLTFTTVQDLAEVVAQAVEFEGEWPVNGGIVGSTLAVDTILRLGEQVRGGKFSVEKLRTEDLENGTWQASWLPVVEHPAVPPEHVESASKIMIAGLLLAIKDKAFECSDEWNQLLPDHKFTDAEEFLKGIWSGKP